MLNNEENTLQDVDVNDKEWMTFLQAENCIHFETGYFCSNNLKIKM
jgi:hypothetical protein